MTKADIEALKVVIYDYAESEKRHGHKRSRWECLQFAARAINDNYVPKELIEYITQLSYQTKLIIK